MEKLVPNVSAVFLLLAILVSYGWFISAAMVHRKRKEMKNPPELDTSYRPFVSVIIPAHNEESVIESTVTAILTLSYENYDLWVIDDRSQDKTPQILRKLKEQYPERFHFYIRETTATPGKSAVLNDALKLTQGEILCVFDADARVDHDFLDKLLPYLSDDSVGAVQARKVISNANVNWLTQCQNYEYSMDAQFQTGRDTIKGAVELRGNGQLVKRKALESVNGWNELSVTDDLDLSTRLHIQGWDIRFAHKVCVREEGIPRLIPLIKQRRRWAEGSLVRYLEHLADVLNSDQVSLRTRLDLVAYIIQFLFPIWIVADYLLVAYDIVSGDTNRVHLLTTAVALPLLCAFFFGSSVISIYRFNRPSILEILRGAATTGVYFSIIWVPTAFWVICKILFQKERRFDWCKTEHSGTTA